QRLHLTSLLGVHSIQARIAERIRRELKHTFPGNAALPHTLKQGPNVGLGPSLSPLLSFPLCFLSHFHHSTEFESIFPRKNLLPYFNGYALTAWILASASCACLCSLNENPVNLCDMHTNICTSVRVSFLHGCAHDTGSFWR
uniref:Uncharacterized protein n=1 Tax=Geospiza parvula TaxID=87175 RepID=A0A8U8BU09_GEOPR